MAKTSMVMRELKRSRLVKKFAAKRTALKETLKDPKRSFEEREDARMKLQQLPRDSSPIRGRSRCRLTGRSRGVYRKFGLGRSELRRLAMEGHVPGLVKASW
ncbi:MAG: 30S ribosomal protein S14 [Gammaproteobacteria bacterium]|nr:30S ribosomal protein S14 [Gammaproteobacteria bacterium]